MSIERASYAQPGEQHDRIEQPEVGIGALWRWIAVAGVGLALVAVLLVGRQGIAPSAAVTLPVQAVPSAPSLSAARPASSVPGSIEYLAPRPAAAPLSASPDMSVIGTGSVYDGGAYGEPIAPRPAISPDAPNVRAGLADDGSAYVEYIYSLLPDVPLARPAASPDMSVIGTGSVYDERFAAPRSSAE